jgi:hypothetical protein
MLNNPNDPSNATNPGLTPDAGSPPGLTPNPPSPDDRKRSTIRQNSFECAAC